MARSKSKDMPLPTTTHMQATPRLMWVTGGFADLAIVPFLVACPE